jgi:hypothetical protein
MSMKGGTGTIVAFGFENQPESTLIASSNRLIAVLK